MKKTIALLLLTLSTSIFAIEVKQSKDDISMAIAVTDNIIEIQMEAPMELLLGFKSKPSNTEEHNQWSQLQGLWFNNLSEIVSLNRYTCIEEESSIEYEIDEELNYGEVLAKAVLKCNTMIKSADLEIKIKQKYPKVENINVTLLPNQGNSRTFKLNSITEKISL